MARMTALFSSLHVPAFMAVSAGALRDDAPALLATEQASIAPMAPARLAEFSQGRWHARTALAQLGVVNVSIPVGRDRAPIWPTGFVGSISHVPPDPGLREAGQVIAVVARANHCSALGVDLERCGRLMPEHWPAFLNPGELAWLGRRSPAQRDALAHGLWSAKEAVMKALQQALDPQAIEIRLRANGQTFVAHCVSAQGQRGADPIRLGGCLRFEPGWVLALATMPPLAAPTY